MSSNSTTLSPCRVLLQPGAGLGPEHLVDLLRDVVVGHQAPAGLRVVERVLPLRRRWRDDLVVLHVAVRQHVVRRADAEVVIESVVRRTGRQRLGEVDLVDLLGVPRVGVDGLAHLGLPPPPEVPLAHPRRGVAVLLEQRGHRQAVLVDQRLGEMRQHAGLHSRPPRVPPRHQPVPRGRALGGGRVCVGESHARFGQCVEVRRGHLSLGVVATQVAQPEIVSQDDHDIRPRARLGPFGLQRPCRHRSRGRKRRRLHESSPAQLHRTPRAVVTISNRRPRGRREGIVTRWVEKGEEKRDWLRPPSAVPVPSFLPFFRHVEWRRACRYTARAH